MSDTHEELTAAAEAVTPQATVAGDADLTFRRDLAFPKLSAEVLERLLFYGEEESFVEDTLLYTYGDRDTDMFFVLSGELKAGSVWKGVNRSASAHSVPGSSPVNLICSTPKER